MTTTWGLLGDLMGNSWGPHGDYLGTTLVPLGLRRFGTKCFGPVNHLQNNFWTSFCATTSISRRIGPWFVNNFDHKFSTPSSSRRTDQATFQMGKMLEMHTHQKRVGQKLLTLKNRKSQASCLANSFLSCVILQCLSSTCCSLCSHCNHVKGWFWTFAAPSCWEMAKLPAASFREVAFRILRVSVLCLDSMKRLHQSPRCFFNSQTSSC